MWKRFSTIKLLYKNNHTKVIIIGVSLRTSIKDFTVTHAGEGGDRNKTEITTKHFKFDIHGRDKRCPKTDNDNL